MLDQTAVSIYSQAGYPYGLLLQFPPLRSVPAFSTPAFSTPAILPVSHFPPLQFCLYRIFHSCIFSRPVAMSKFLLRNFFPKFVLDLSTTAFGPLSFPN